LEGGEQGKEGRKKRKPKNGKINKNGKKLSFLEEREWGEFLTGAQRRDEEGEHTFTGGKDNTVIDYVLGDEEIKREVERLRVGERVNSDHHSVEV